METLAWSFWEQLIGGCCGIALLAFVFILLGRGDDELPKNYVRRGPSFWDVLVGILGPDRFRLSGRQGGRKDTHF